MNRKTLTLLFFFSTAVSFGQNRVLSSEILSHQETRKVFTDLVNKQFDINYPIRRVYRYLDRSGQFFIVLTESNDLKNGRKDTLHHHIKAHNFHMEKNGLLKKWEIVDAITKQPGTDEMENSIWFWTKYTDFKDIDNDGLIDPVIIYGTSGMNHIDDGRIKILIYYKGKKFAVRHQNGTLDFERNTRVDKAFYTLPVKIQEHVKLIMKKMIDEGNAIFPYGWQKAMKAHKIFFDEN
ncbi:M949_RS01915 family surface polysaccharide biosynthesis protein [Pedobacter africanus]|uniref:Uncharacterized protein n=1 Tax=Pedobacter africanus TaxID=151894 RepID=A0A1W1ZXR8_9SPHI|nr:hypothetical protein [Pedobacter africanus]SMC53156.1 hypothetical protein SAMN04488524_1058 [Pedobacter africanus]